MRAMLDKDTTTDWEAWLAPCALAFNCHVHKSTRETPFFLTYLHDPNLPFCDFDQPRKLYGENYAHAAYNAAQSAYFMVKDNLEEAQKKQEDYFNKSAKERTYTKGQRVLCHFPNVPPGVNQKFMRRWRMFTVKRMIGPVNVELQESAKSKPITVHINRTRLATPAERASTAPNDDVTDVNDICDEGAKSAETTQFKIRNSGSEEPVNPAGKENEITRGGGLPLQARGEGVQVAPDCEVFGRPDTPTPKFERNRERSTRYNLRPRPRRRLPHPVSAIKASPPGILALFGDGESADNSDEDEEEEGNDWIYVFPAPINDAVGLQTPVRRPSSACLDHRSESESCSSSEFEGFSSPTTLPGNILENFSTAHENINFEEFSTAASVIPVPTWDSYPSSDEESVQELEQAGGAAFRDCAAALASFDTVHPSSASAATCTGSGGAVVTREDGDRHFADPHTWDNVAHVLLPAVRPFAGPHTRSSGRTLEVPLPLHCPVYGRRRRPEGDGQEERGRGEQSS